MATMMAMIDTIAYLGEISVADARKVFELYRKLRLLKLDPYQGYQVKDGGFLDRAVIQDALMRANEDEKVNR